MEILFDIQIRVLHAMVIKRIKEKYTQSFWNGRHLYLNLNIRSLKYSVKCFSVIRWSERFKLSKQFKLSYLQKIVILKVFEAYRNFRHLCLDVRVPSILQYCKNIYILQYNKNIYHFDLPFSASFKLVAEHFYNSKNVF